MSVIIVCFIREKRNVRCSYQSSNQSLLLFFYRHYPIIWILKAIRLLIVFVMICTITYKFLLVLTSRGVSLLGFKNNRLGWWYQKRERFQKNNKVVWVKLVSLCWLNKWGKINDILIFLIAKIWNNLQTKPYMECELKA